MKYLAIFIFYFFGWFISIPFKDFEATQQKSYGGRARSGSTIHYQFKMVSQVPSTKLEFKSLWIGVNNVEFSAYTLNDKNQQQQAFERGDTIYIEAFVHSKIDNNGNLTEEVNHSNPPPIEYKGMGLLNYIYKGKSKYYTIEKIKALPKVYYP